MKLTRKQLRKIIYESINEARYESTKARDTAVVGGAVGGAAGAGLGLAASSVFPPASFVSVPVGTALGGYIGGKLGAVYAGYKNLKSGNVAKDDPLHPEQIYAMLSNINGWDQLDDIKLKDVIHDYIDQNHGYDNGIRYTAEEFNVIEAPNMAKLVVALDALGLLEEETWWLKTKAILRKLPTIGAFF